VRQWFTNYGRLSDNMRDNILNTVERTARQRWIAFEQEKAHLAPLYQNMGIRPEDIFGSWNTPTFVTMTMDSSSTMNAGGIPNPVASGSMSGADFFPDLLNPPDTTGGIGG
jgi:hypothetical protein